MKTLLYLIFFLSGASALIFETLWFRLCGLTFGNSVWSTSIVLSSFMGGLALGNSLAARYSHRIKTPVLLYSAFEAVIAVTGFGLVLVLPLLTTWLAPLFRLYLDAPVMLNVFRLITVFILLILPTTAMGFTLPLLVKALHSGSSNFGEILGRLYGWNTLGAVAGSLAGEAFLIKWFGIRATGLIAALLNLAAASTALYLSKRCAFASVEEQEVRFVFTGRTKRLLTAAFVSGAIFLSLEVIWYRFLLLFFSATSIVFALMLGIILAGIGLGGLLASRLLHSYTKIHASLTFVLFLSGSLVFALYYGFRPVQIALESLHRANLWILLALSIYLMLPVSVLSGITFTFVGSSLFENISAEARTTGILTLVNTMGGMLGALVAGFILIPFWGMERSFFSLGLAYGAVAVLLLLFEIRDWWNSPVRKYSNFISFVVFTITLAIFPFGKMEEVFMESPRASFMKNMPSARVVKIREGLTETIQYIRSDVFGFPYYYLLITNNHLMTGTNLNGQRMRRLFVYLPIAVNPNMKNALLISFGVGETAKALTDTKVLREIHIVDISKDILELSDVIYPKSGDNPLNDPRVRVHVEDGRFVLQTTPLLFDIITAEPPPPRHAGVVNLYTQDFFQLIYDHLSEGGVVTYWLPVYMLKEPETKSILKAFCSVFNDCSLWSGAGLDLVMMGSHNLNRAPSEEEFSRQWNDPVVSPKMKAVGLEVPEQLGTLLLADTSYLHEITRDSQPLTDNYPMRIITDFFEVKDRSSDYNYWSEIPRQFATSTTLQKLWPKGLRLKTEEYVRFQKPIDDFLWRSIDIGFPYPFFPDLHSALTESSLRFPILLLMGSDPIAQTNLDKAIASGLYSERSMLYHLAARSLSERKYTIARQQLAKLLELSPNSRDMYYFGIYLASLTKDREMAVNLTKKLLSIYGIEEKNRNKRFWDWLEGRFGLNL